MMRFAALAAAHQLGCAQSTCYTETVLGTRACVSSASLSRKVWRKMHNAHQQGEPLHVLAMPAPVLRLCFCSFVHMVMLLVS
jgi:hypothetical protein